MEGHQLLRHTIGLQGELSGGRDYHYTSAWRGDRDRRGTGGRGQGERDRRGTGGSKEGRKVLTRKGEREFIGRLLYCAGGA